MTMFKFKKDNDVVNPGTSTFNFKKVIFIGLLGFFLVTYFLWQTIIAYQKVTQNWEELRFAYNKPALVKIVREEYIKKQKELDQTFTQLRATEQDKLIQELTKQLKDQSKE